MTKRAFRPLAIMLSLLLVASVPVQASPVTLADVIQMISGNPRYGGQAPVMKLRTTTQEDKAQKSNPTSSTNSSSQQGGGDVSTQQDPPVTNDPPVQTQTEEVGEIAITNCECGDLPDEIVEIPGRRNFLPFIPLIGLICVTGICSPDDTPTPPSTPTPTPPPPPIPEPATLLLFGSGLAALGAGARRRHARAKLAKQAEITEG
ncbi:MAG TPA: PEP-CTERM sorting domain-containing protein [Pyrinomonadaceae bacterium]